MDLGEAFGVYPPRSQATSTGYNVREGSGGGESRKHSQHTSYDEDIRLAPYTYRSTGTTGEYPGGSQTGHQLRTDWHEDESPTSSTASASSAKRLVSPSTAPGMDRGMQAQQTREFDYDRSQARVSVSASAISEGGYSGIGQAV